MITFDEDGQVIPNYDANNNGRLLAERELWGGFIGKVVDRVAKPISELTEKVINKGISIIEKAGPFVGAAVGAVVGAVAGGGVPGAIAGGKIGAALGLKGQQVIKACYTASSLASKISKGLRFECSASLIVPAIISDLTKAAPRSSGGKPVLINKSGIFSKAVRLIKKF